MKTIPCTATLFAAIAALAGCAAEPVYQQPYALFTTEQAGMQSGSNPTFRIRVDGTQLEPRDSVPVAVGTRTVELTPVDYKGSGPSPSKISTDAQACTRYVLVAKRSAPTSDDWTVAVNSTEPIGECHKKFGSSPKQY